MPSDLITYTTKVQGQVSAYPTNQILSYLDVNEIKTVINSHASDLDGHETRISDLETNGGITNVVIITALADFPAPSASVITLADNTAYSIVGAIDISTNRLVMGSNTTIRGNSPALDYITSDTTGALMTSTSNFRLFEVGFSASSGTIFDLNGTGAEICLCFGVRFFGTGGLGSVDAYDLFEITTGLFVSYTSGLLMSGSCGTFVLHDVTFYETTGITTLDLDTATFNSFKISICDFTVANGGTGIDIAASSANINSGGSGIIIGTSFNLTGTGVSTVGYSPLDLRWTIGATNTNILTSDRLSPTGWGFYEDDETGVTTVSVTTSPVLLTIDGLGANSDSDYLPASIRGSSELWSSDSITPITIGDSYNVRLDLEVSAKTGSPDALTIQLDIGGGGTPTTVIVSTDQSISKSTPFTLSTEFTIFTKTTFKTNGGQFFISVNTGTCTIASRAITIQRVSSGVS